MKSLHAPNILTLLRTAVDAVPSAPCITDLRMQQTWTYEDLWHGTLHLTALRPTRACPQEIISRCVPGTIQSFSPLFACAMQGAVLVPINPERCVWNARRSSPMLM